MSRLSRFLHLERPRSAPGEAPDGPDDATSARFEALQSGAPTAPSASPAAQGHLARFEAPREGGLQVETKRVEDQPFIRCAGCEGDNSRFARTCQHCQADLDTPAQRAFNQALWERRQAERDAERAQAQALAQAREADARAQAQARLASYRALADDVRRETLGRLGASDVRRGLFLQTSWRGLQLRLGVGLAVAAVICVLAFVRAGVTGGLKALPFVALLGFGLWYVRRSSPGPEGRSPPSA